MVLLYAPGFSPGVVDQTPWAACQHTWVGWDGSEWDLSHGLSGLALQAGTRGLEDAPIIHYKSKSAALAGSSWRGFNIDERECLWLLKVYSNGGSAEWIKHNRRFRRTLLPDRTGQWVVTQPVTGERRTLTVRFTGLQDDSWDIDPSLQGARVYGFLMGAENPLWMGEPITRTFDNTDAENFYGGAAGGGFGPPFFLSSGTLVSSASIVNPGDVSVWPTYRVDGPSDTATINGVTFPMTLADGEWVSINADPSDQVAVDDTGADRTSELEDIQNLAEIPIGDPIPLEITMTGSGTVTVTITPAYLRAL
jgi:hypothetical protein